MFLLTISNITLAEHIDIKSDRLKFDDKRGIAVYTGNVVANKDDKYLYAEQVTIYRDLNGKVESIIALGSPTKFNYNKTTGEANRIEYFPKLEKMILIENAKIFNNNEYIMGIKLNYYLKQKTLTSAHNNTIIIHPSSK